MNHTSAVFEKYISEPVNITTKVQEKVQGALGILKADPSKVEMGLAIKLLECSRKVDKILLYSLQSIVSDLQKDPMVKDILSFELTKMRFLLDFHHKGLEEELELNILAILEGLCNLQSQLPFAFTSFLS